MSELPCINIAASRVSGLMGKGGSSLSKVQAELQTLHSNILSFPGHRDTLQAIFDKYPQRFRDTFFKKRKLETAAKLIISNDEELGRAVQGVRQSAKNVFGAVMDLKSTVETSVASVMVDTEAAPSWMTTEDLMEKEMIDEVEAEIREQDEILLQEVFEQSHPELQDDPDAVEELAGWRPAALKAPTMPPVAKDLAAAAGMKGIANAVMHHAAMSRGNELEDRALEKVNALGTKRRGIIKLECCNASIKGECDGVKMEDPELGTERVVEVKNIMWEMKNGPSDKHWIQLEAYMRIFGIPQGCVCLQCNDRVKTYDGDSDDTLWKEMQDAVAALVAKWKYCAEHGTLKMPKKGKTKPRAKKAGTDRRTKRRDMPTMKKAPNKSAISLFTETVKRKKRRKTVDEEEDTLS